MTRPRALLPFLLLAPLILTACAARGETASRSTSNQIVREDLTRYFTVWEAVEARRSTWLRQRTSLFLDPTSETGARPAHPVWVYRDGTAIGDINVLRNLSTAEIEVVEYFDARTATLRWGTSHENGVIHLTSRMGPVPS